jgi:hypothetical protein
MFRITPHTSITTIDVLAFPPDEAELDRLQGREAERWRELERRARLAIFFSIGMFLAWAADVGAAFEMDHSGSTIFGLAAVPMAIVIVLAHLAGRWALERARTYRIEWERRYAYVRKADAASLLSLARRDSVIAQYLRLVSRQGRPLRVIEKTAMEAWAAER